MIQLADLVKEVVGEARDYKDEYKKFQSSKKMKKYRAELNKYNRKKGTYGNGDGKDASHKGGKISGYEVQSKNRGRREKSRLKKESDSEQHCEHCKYFIADKSLCMAVSPPDVSPYGWCKLWREGEPTVSKRNSPKELISKTQVGYVDNNI